MATKTWDLDIGSPEGHLKLEDSPLRLKEIKDHAATGAGFYTEAQTTPDKTVAIYEGVVYFGATKVEYDGLAIADLGTSGAFEVSAITANYFNKILFTINSAGTLEATEGTEGATAGAVVEPSIPQNKFPICIVTVQDNGSGTAGTIETIEQGEIKQLQGFGRVLELLDENDMASDSATKTASQQSIKAYTVAASLLSVPSGEKILFYKNTAVVGYSLLNTLDNKVVYVTKGSVAGGQTGGAVHSSGSWTISGLAADSHTLTTAEIPAHDHDINYSRAGGTGPYCPVVDVDGNVEDTANTTAIQNTGGGGGHVHGVTHTPAWRPAAYNFTIQQRT